LIAIILLHTVTQVMAAPIKFYLIIDSDGQVSGEASTIVGHITFFEKKRTIVQSDQKEEKIIVFSSTNLRIHDRLPIFYCGNA